MRDRRLTDAIGLCMKAGRCRSGDFVAERLARAGAASLVLLDAHVSAATRERYERLCERGGIPVLVVPALGTAIGKPERMVAAVTDQGFANMIQRAAADTPARDDLTSKTNDRGHEQNGEQRL